MAGRWPGSLVAGGLVVLVVFGVLVALWCLWTARRLDRLRVRCESARSALSGQLSRRSALAVQAAQTGPFDPASAVLLLDAAGRARGAEAGDWAAESDLTATLRVVLAGYSAAEPSVSRLVEATRSVEVARRIHNQLSVRAGELRGRRRVRWFCLAGPAPAPVMIEFDDHLHVEPPNSSL